jgi:hypothetical protein
MRGGPSRRTSSNLAAGRRDLRDYLQRLPNFDDFEAEERALAFAEQYGGLTQAVAFLVSRPSLDRAARVATHRAKELDDNQYHVLTPAAASLSALLAPLWTGVAQVCRITASASCAARKPSRPSTRSPV